MKISWTKRRYIWCVIWFKVAGENLHMYHNGTANVFSNMERIYHSPNFYKFRVVRDPHTRSCIYREFWLDMEDKTFSIFFGYEEVTSQEPRFSDRFADLKIDALYIFQVLLTTHHFSSKLKWWYYNTKASAKVVGGYSKQTDMKNYKCYGVPHTNLKNKLTSWEKRKINLKEHFQRWWRGYLTVQTRQEIRRTHLWFQRCIRKLRCLYHCNNWCFILIQCRGSFIQGRWIKEYTIPLIAREWA
jgi:hypothetical protein